MKTMSGTLQSQMKQTLRFFGLADQYGNTTPDLDALAESQGSQRQELLRHIVKRSYSFLSDDTFDVRRATQNALEEKFRQTGASGDTIRKCVAFFVNISKDAGIELSSYILNQPTG
jgi:hypothetical protein